MTFGCISFDFSIFALNPILVRNCKHIYQRDEVSEKVKSFHLEEFLKLVPSYVIKVSSSEGDSNR